MKRLLILFSIATVATSCLGDAAFSNSYPVQATFEYSDGFFNADSLYYDVEEKQLGFSWDYLAFYHNVDKSTSEFKGGFILSRLAIPESGITEGLKNNRYRVNVKDAPNKFAVFYQSDDMPQKHLEFFFSSDEIKSSCTMNSVFVSNTVEVAEAVKATFEPGYQLLLKATGYLKDKDTVTGVAEIKLADITAARDSIVSSWTAFNLSELGSIDYVKFSIETVPEGLDIPRAVCMDYLLANISLTSE